MGTGPAGAFKGRYDCVMGTLSPMQGQDIPPPKVGTLIRCVRDEQVRDVIFAFDSDVESAATTTCLHEKLAETGIQVMRLAFGISAGSGLAYSDPVTLARASQGRHTR